MLSAARKTSGPFNGIYMVTTPMPFPLKTSNGFIGEGDHGWIIIDGGVNTERNRQIWDIALSEIGINWQQISAIYLTHYHHDHLGLGGWMQQKSEAPVYLSAQDAVKTRELLLLSARDYIQLFIEECSRHNWDSDLLALLADDIVNIAGLLDPMPQVSILDQSGFSMAGYRVKPMSAPGHSDGHQVFLIDNNCLFSGDNLLANYHLHATDWPHNRLANPLYWYLSSMNDLASTPIELVFPGHGPVFENFSERLQLLYAHHLLRIKHVLPQLTHPMSAWQLAQKVFPHAEYIHIKRLILAETLAYLQLLESSHLVISHFDGTAVIYSPVPDTVVPGSILDLIRNP